LSRQEEVIVAVIHRLPILWLLTTFQDDPPHDIGYATPISLHSGDVRQAVAMLRPRPIKTMPY
jgi:hypothetical protein